MPEPSSDPDARSLRQLHAHHPRHWLENLYVYPVISRRSRGLSIGVNLNPDKACNFDCIYCQVDRTVPPTVRKVDPVRLRVELESMIDLAVTGRLFEEDGFQNVPADHRQVRDIAFSGDGEPTASPHFPDAVALAAEVRRSRHLLDAQLRLITDAAYLTRPAVRDALAVMHDNNGEIWAKLDAGTEEYYRLVNRPNVPLETVLANILDAARQFNVVIQSLWMNIHDLPPPEPEIDAFADRLSAILAGGGRLRLVQVYTVARQTAEPYASPLNDAQLQSIAERVRSRVDVPIEVFGS
ncbi:MAG TPA: radical SAM protein [Phycisphaerae bacterium]|nr:radical SAM protein [Phycisphaerae bacterium]